MLKSMLKSKLHRATVSGASVDYEGSLTIAADLAQRVDLLEHERVLVGNISNGERFETYVIYGEHGSGAIELNGATARLGRIGDRLTIMNFALYSPEEAAGHQPKFLLLDERNQIVRAS